MMGVTPCGDSLIPALTQGRAASVGEVIHLRVPEAQGSSKAGMPTSLLSLLLMRACTYMHVCVCV